MYCTIEPTDRHEASRGLSVTAELLIYYTNEGLTLNNVFQMTCVCRVGCSDNLVIPESGMFRQFSQI